jgi:superfamily II DNA or RNA helicase
MSEHLDKVLTKIGYQLLKSHLTDDQLIKIRSDLTISPIVDDRYVSTPPEYKFYKEVSWGIIVPKQYGIDEFGKPANTTLPEPQKIDIICETEPYDFQKEVWAKMVDIYEKPIAGGTMSIPCGFGKTFLAIKLISLLKVKTMIIAHNATIMEQWRSEIGRFATHSDGTPLTIGIIQQDSFQIDVDVSICMLMSIATRCPTGKYDYMEFKQFGLVIYDEAHHLPAEIFSQSLSYLTCRRSLALSATLDRKDGMIAALYKYVGNPFHIYKRTECVGDVVMLKSNIVPIGSSYQSLIVSLSTNEDRNKLLMTTLTNLHSDESNKILVITLTREHVEFLFEQCKLITSTVVKYYGGCRDLLACKSSELIIGTMSMAKEGLNLPHINTIVFASPPGCDISTIEQSIGRAMRLVDGMPRPCKIFDIIDKHVIFVNHWKKRKTYYESIGLKIIK